MYRIALEHLHYAICHAMMLGYPDGAYIYSRMLARFALDLTHRESRVGRFDWGVSLS